jgi:2-polyprenyl-3-methyl-5-hydroxy-6-metoxy-1,4-benzoquinol methylase
MKRYSDNYYKNNGQLSDRPALGMYFRMLKKIVEKNKKVLDFGAGSGYLSRRIALNYQSFAYEISEFAIKNIKKISPDTILIKNDNDLAKYEFDAIIALHSFEHIKNPNELIYKLIKSMKKGGKLLMVVPNVDGLGHKIKKENWFGFRDKTHISLLSPTEWKNILKSNGLFVEKTGSDWFWDPPYLPLVPLFIQKLIFYPGCLLMVVLSNIFYPESWGEDLIILAGKD